MVLMATLRTTVRTTLRAALVVAIVATIAGCRDEEPRQPSPEAGSRPHAGAAPLDSQTVRLSTAEPVTKYGVRSGIIEYDNVRLGRAQTYYFDDYGAQEAVYLARNGKDSVGVPFDISIYTGTYRFDVNTTERTGIVKVQPNATGPVLGLVPDLGAVRSTPIASRTIAGRRAEGLEFTSGGGTVRVWQWKGIPLRVERPLRAGADTLVLEAVRFEPDAKVDPSRFVVPKGIALTRLR
jgi:hypothetical protein